MTDNEIIPISLAQANENETKVGEIFMTDKEIIEFWEHIVELAESCDPTARIPLSVGSARETYRLIIRLKRESNKYRYKAQAQKGEIARLNKQVAEQKAEIANLHHNIKCVKVHKEKLIEQSKLQKAEIERLQKLQKPTQTSGFIIQNGKVVFYTNILNGYRHEYKDIDEVVRELNLLLQRCYKCDEVISHYEGKLKQATAEAIKEFADLLIKRIRKNVTPIPQQMYLVKMCIQEIYNLVKEMAGD